MNPPTPQAVRALGDFINLIQLAVSDKGVKALVDKAADTLEEAKTIREEANTLAAQNKKDQVALEQGFAQLDEQKETFLAAKNRAEKKVKDTLDDAEDYKKKLANEIKAAEDNIAAREKVVNDREYFLNGREKEIDEQTVALEAKKSDLDKLEAELNEKLENLRKAVA